MPSPAIANVYKIRLQHPSDRSQGVIFDVTPTISEQISVSYKQVDPVHMPGSFVAYTNTPSRQFGLSDIKLISRTSAEASYNLQKLQMLRAWSKPKFGKNSGGPEPLGAPPAVLLLNAYSRGTGNSPNGQILQHLHNIPVVITQLTINYPNDVDYIPTSVNDTPMPTIMTIEISLTETHSPQEYENFDLQKYKKGLLAGF